MSAPIHIVMPEIVDRENRDEKNLIQLVRLWEKLSEGDRQRFRRHIEGTTRIDMEGEILPTSQVAKMLHIPFYKVKELARTGALRPCEVNRPSGYYTYTPKDGDACTYKFRRSDVLAYIAAHPKENGLMIVPCDLTDEEKAAERQEFYQGFDFDKFVADLLGVSREVPDSAQGVIVDALMTLHTRERLVVRLRYKGKVLWEIGNALGVSPGRAREIWVRALRLLRVPARSASIQEAVGCEPDPTRSKDDIGFLEFSARTYNCLRRAGIKTIEDLTKLTPRQLLEIRHFGSQCLSEVNDALSSLNLSLRT